MANHKKVHSMGTRFGSIVALLISIVIGCTTVDPEDCWVNTSGGLGGAEQIPIGAGVGVSSSGDFFASPPSDPQAATGTPNPCLTPESTTVAKFSRSDFPFFVINKDDGKEDGGGWQEAKANLEFIRVNFPKSVITWYCPFTIGMPLRTKAMGKISATRAADYSVEITEDAARSMDYTLPQGIFCGRYVEEVRNLFKSRYPNLGSRVNK